MGPMLPNFSLVHCFYTSHWSLVLRSFNPFDACNGAPSCVVGVVIPYFDTFLLLLGIQLLPGLRSSR